MSNMECMLNVGFYVEAKGFKPMPLGNTEDYAIKIRNIYENPELLDYRML